MNSSMDVGCGVEYCLATHVSNDQGGAQLASHDRRQARLDTYLHADESINQKVAKSPTGESIGSISCRILTCWRRLRHAGAKRLLTYVAAPPRSAANLPADGHFAEIGKRHNVGAAVRKCGDAQLFPGTVPSDSSISRPDGDRLKNAWIAGQLVILVVRILGTTRTLRGHRAQIARFSLGRGQAIQRSVGPWQLGTRIGNTETASGDWRCRPTLFL
jgi:hypothetical protein